MRILPTLAPLATAAPPTPGTRADAAPGRVADEALADAPAGDAGAESRAAVEQAVAKANRQMSVVAPALQFEVDPDLGQVIVRLVDRQSQNVLRQVPSPEMLAIARALDRMEALLVRARA